MNRRPPSPLDEWAGSTLAVEAERGRVAAEILELRSLRDLFVGSLNLEGAAECTARINSLLDGLGTLADPGVAPVARHVV